MEDKRRTQQSDIPLMFFIFGFIVILVGLFSKIVFNSKPRSLPIAPQTKRIKKLIPPNTLDYDKPIDCMYLSLDATVSAQLSGTSAAMSITSKTIETKMTLIGDCVYTWHQGSTSGSRQCGLGTYVKMGKQLLASGMVNSDIVSIVLSQMGKKVPANMGEILKSCTNIEAVKRGTFDIPTGIQFK